MKNFTDQSESSPGTCAMKVLATQRVRNAIQNWRCIFL